MVILVLTDTLTGGINTYTYCSGNMIVVTGQAAKKMRLHDVHANIYLRVFLVAHVYAMCISAIPVQFLLPVSVA